MKNNLYTTSCLICSKKVECKYYYDTNKEVGYIKGNCEIYYFYYNEIFYPPIKQIIIKYDK